MLSSGLPHATSTVYYMELEMWGARQPPFSDVGKEFLCSFLSPLHLSVEGSLSHGLDVMECQEIGVWAAINFTKF